MRNTNTRELNTDNVVVVEQYLLSIPPSLLSPLLPLSEENMFFAATFDNIINVAIIIIIMVVIYQHHNHHHFITGHSSQSPLTTAETRNIGQMATQWQPSLLMFFFISISISNIIMNRETVERHPPVTNVNGVSSGLKF